MENEDIKGEEKVFIATIEWKEVSGCAINIIQCNSNDAVIVNFII